MNLTWPFNNARASSYLVVQTSSCQELDACSSFSVSLDVPPSQHPTVQSLNSCFQSPFPRRKRRRPSGHGPRWFKGRLPPEMQVYLCSSYSAHKVCKHRGKREIGQENTRGGNHFLLILGSRTFP